MTTEQSDCIFCKIISGQIPCYKVFENQSVLAFLDIGPISEGHTLVLSKTHYERMDQCPSTVLAEVSGVLGQIALAVTAAVNAPAFNVLCNNGSEAGQAVGHLHFHIIPRSTGDRVFTQWPAFQYSAGRAEEILRKITEKINIRL